MWVFREGSVAQWLSVAGGLAKAGSEGGADRQAGEALKVQL